MANKKTSDYIVLPSGIVDDTWLLDIANPTVVNYKGTALETKDYVNAGKVGGKNIDGGTLTTQTLTLRNNAIDDLGVDIEADGILHVNTVNYETLVTDDDDIPNKKYVDDEAAKVIAQIDEFLPTPGQTAFVLSKTPSGDNSFGVFLNGKRQLTSKYSRAGTALTWLDNPVLISGDTLVAWYDWQAPSPGLSLGTYPGTMPVGGANLVVTAVQLGLTDARQIVISELTAKGLDQNWWKSGNSFAATHAFSYSIPTGADPNVGDMVIQAPAGSTTILGQPFEFVYYYQATNFLS